MEHRLPAVPTVCCLGPVASDPDAIAIQACMLSIGRFVHNDVLPAGRRSPIIDVSRQGIQRLKRSGLQAVALAILVSKNV